MDKYWINMWKFFVIVTLLACFMMGVLYAMNKSCQKSSECFGEEAEAIDGITNALWDDFKVIIPTMIFILIISYWISLKFAKTKDGEEK